MKRQTKPKSLDNTTYNRLGGKDSDDDENTELISIPKSTFKEIKTIDKELEEGDTLQNLAIRYHSTIHELKRINKIQNENEIYAKHYIKVPHRPFTMLLSANNMATVHTSGSTSPTTISDDLIDINNDSTVKSIRKPLDVELLENSLLAIPTGIDPEDEVNAVIFNSTVSTHQSSNRSLNSATLSINNTHNLSIPSSPEPGDLSDSQITSPLFPIAKDDDSLEDITQSSATRRPKVRVVKPSWLWDGADADISWIALITCVVVLILAVPLIYVLYIAEHPDLYHHEHPGHHHNKSWAGHDNLHAGV